MNKKILRVIYMALSFFIFIIYLNMKYYDDYQTLLLEGTFIQNNQSDLVANNWSVPLVLDWNSDGKKDLLIGNRSYDKQNGSKGYISFFENKGTDSSPIFNGSVYVKVCADICSELTVIPDG